MNVIVCSYRDWARDVAKSIERHPRVNVCVHAHDKWELGKYLAANELTHEFDAVLFVGWSDPPDEYQVSGSTPMFSEHPATSDRYSPGTPLQNQILDGVRYTKHRIVKVGFPELAPRQWSHEVDMDLSGSMEDVLAQMAATSKQLFNMFLDDYPNITWKTWDAVPPEDQVPRRVPGQSRIDKSKLASLTARRLYDVIRCLESPYPNAYVEDETGTLYFERVRFKSK